MVLGESTSLPKLSKRIFGLHNRSGCAQIRNARNSKKFKYSDFLAISIALDLLKCDLFVGADGPNSAARQALGMKALQYPYAQSANVCVVEATRPIKGAAFQWFGKEGPLAFLPLSQSGMYAVIWSSPQDFGIQPDDYFEKEINRRTQGDLGKLKVSTKRRCFPLQQKHALKYVIDGVALIRDSAHTIHPLAGQGGNLGFERRGSRR